MSLEKAITKTDSLLQAMEQVTPTPITRMVVTGLKDIKNNIINEIPVVLEKKWEVGDKFIVTVIQDRTFGKGEELTLIELCEDDVHCYSNGSEADYMEKNEVQLINK